MGSQFIERLFPNAVAKGILHILGCHHQKWDVNLVIGQFVKSLQDVCYIELVLILARSLALYI